MYTVGTLDGIDPHAICCLPAWIEYSFASGLNGEELWRLQSAVSCPITVFREVYCVLVLVMVD